MDVDDVVAMEECRSSGSREHQITRCCGRIPLKSASLIIGISYGLVDGCLATACLGLALYNTNTLLAFTDDKMLQGIFIVSALLYYMKTAANYVLIYGIDKGLKSCVLAWLIFNSVHLAYCVLVILYVTVPTVPFRTLLYFAGYFYNALCIYNLLVVSSFYRKMKPRDEYLEDEDADEAAEDERPYWYLEPLRGQLGSAEKLDEEIGKPEVAEKEGSSLVNTIQGLYKSIKGKKEAKVEPEQFEEKNELNDETETFLGENLNLELRTE